MVKTAKGHFEINCALCKTLKKKCTNEFKCNDCGSSFIGKGDLKRHINVIHLKLKHYECDQCNKSFTQESNLKVHINAIHLKLEPYECDQCKKSFAHKHYLQQHVNLVHVRLYECEQCKKSFSDKRRLEQHAKKVHMNCTVCDFTSVFEKNLKIHLKTVHQKARTHKCDQCKKSFSLKRHLNTHMKGFCKGFP